MKNRPLLSRNLITTSVSQTQKLGAQLGRLLKKGDVVLLIANLGSGKTTFAQGVVKGLGIKEQALSPTFILAQSFSGKIPVHHLDFYRLTPQELLDIGIEDYFTGLGQIEKGVVLIEWADRFKKIWPAERLELRIVPSKKNTHRKFGFKAVGKRYVDLLKSL